MHQAENDSFERGTEFLHLILTRLDSAGITYCIERNYEGYPTIITGDIDILVSRAGLGAAIQETLHAARDLDWHPFAYYRAPHLAYLGFWASNFPSRFVLVIEFFAGAGWRGLSFLSPDRAIRMRQRYNDVWKPHPAHEALITLLHHLLYNGQIYEKYRCRVKNLIEISPITFAHEASQAFGMRQAKALTSFVLSEDWDTIERMAGKVRKSFLVRSFALAPLRSMVALCRATMGTRQRPEGVIISLDNLSHEPGEQIASGIIELAERWHIFIPPNRKRIMYPGPNATKLIKMVIASGGVAVVINSSGSAPSIPLHFPIAHVFKKNDIYFAHIGSEKTQELDLTLIAGQLWNLVLRDRANYLSKSL